MYCQHQHVEQEESEDDQAHQSTVRFRPPKAGTKYAVVDLGGMDNYSILQYVIQAWHAQNSTRKFNIEISAKY